MKKRSTKRVRKNPTVIRSERDAWEHMEKLGRRLINKDGTVHQARAAGVVIHHVSERMLEQLGEGIHMNARTSRARRKNPRRGRSEMQQASTLMRSFTKPQITQFPSKKWGFVGRVPMELAHRMRDGSTMTVELAKKIQSFGPGVFKHLIQTVAFDTKAEAEAALVAYRPTIGENPRRKRRKR